MNTGKPVANDWNRHKDSRCYFKKKQKKLKKDLRNDFESGKIIMSTKARRTK